MLTTVAMEVTVESDVDMQQHNETNLETSLKLYFSACPNGTLGKNIGFTLGFLRSLSKLNIVLFCHCSKMKVD